MKTRYKHIHFVDSHDNDSKPVYLCYNKADELLYRDEYYPPWKQYVSITVSLDIVFSESCHRDIAHFIGQLKK